MLNYLSYLFAFLPKLLQSWCIKKGKRDVILSPIFSSLVKYYPPVGIGSSRGDELGG